METGRPQSLCNKKQTRQENKKNYQRKTTYMKCRIKTQARETTKTRKHIQQNTHKKNSKKNKKQTQTKSWKNTRVPLELAKSEPVAEAPGSSMAASFRSWPLESWKMIWPVSGGSKATDSTVDADEGAGLLFGERFTGHSAARCPYVPQRRQVLALRPACTSTSLSFLALRPFCSSFRKGRR